MPATKVAGTTMRTRSLSFDATTEEAVQWQLGELMSYTSGNFTLTLYWYGDTATSGDVVWSGALAAVTPNTDTTDIETDTFASESTATDSHLGTTAHRIHTVDVTLSNLDSIADGDVFWLRVAREAANGSDTMTGDAQLIAATLTWS